MSRSGPILALVVAVILIGSAGVVRYKTSRVSPGELEVTGTTTGGTIATAPTYPEEVWNSTSTAPNLTQTDLIGRQMFSDYVELATKGQTTSEGINQLASSYAQSIVGLANSSFSPISEVKTVPDTAENLKIYSTKLAEIRTKYQNLATAAAKKSNVESATMESFAEFAGIAETLFSNATSEFRALPVPISLKSSHLALVNNYLSSADNMQTVSSALNDPVRLYSALIAQSKASEEEISLYSGIQKSLQLSGIISPTDGI